MTNKLIKRFILLPIILISLLAGGYSHAAADPQDTLLKKYEIIVQHNIFSRTRSTRMADDISRDADAPINSTEAVKSIMYVLRGIAIDNQSRRLFVENELTGQTFQLEIKDQFNGMLIKDIQSDYAVVQVGEKEVQIKVGFDLSAGQASVGSSRGPAGLNTKSDTQKSQFLGIEKEDDLLKQLMARRKRELGTEK